MSFSEWARGRSQLEILRTGWPQAGPWELCTWDACPGRVEYGHLDHCYSEVSADDARLHICVYVDVDALTKTVLAIVDAARIQQTRRG